MRVEDCRNEQVTIDDLDYNRGFYHEGTFYFKVRPLGKKSVRVTVYYKPALGKWCLGYDPETGGIVPFQPNTVVQPVSGFIRVLNNR